MEGMLLQEYVADLLEVRIPGGWEESVRKVYGQNTGEQTDEDEDSADNINIVDPGDQEDTEHTHSDARPIPPGMHASRSI